MTNNAAGHAKGGRKRVREGNRVAIVAGLRSPFARASGALRNLRSVELGTEVVKELVQRTDLDTQELTLCVFGQVVPTVDWLNIAREVVLRSGLPAMADPSSLKRQP